MRREATEKRLSGVHRRLILSDNAPHFLGGWVAYPCRYGRSPGLSRGPP
jgi:hypothetical protein